MPYPVAKLLKEKQGDQYKLTSDGSHMLNEILNKLERKLAHASKQNYATAPDRLLGEDLAGAYAGKAMSNASDAQKYKSSSEATKELGLVFPVHMSRGGDLAKAVYMATFLETVAKEFLANAVSHAINKKVGKAQLINGFSFDKKDSSESTFSAMSSEARLAWKLGYVAPRPTSKQLQNPKYTDYGMQSILASKGFQAVKQKLDKDGGVEYYGLSYLQCMTVLLFRKRGTGCAKEYQTRNLLTGRCEGKKPCAPYQTRNEAGRCVGSKPARKSKKSTRRSKKRSCKRGRKKSGSCKRKPGPKRKRSRR